MRIRTKPEAFANDRRRDETWMTAEDAAIVHDLRHVGFMAWLNEASGEGSLRNREAQAFRNLNQMAGWMKPRDRANWFLSRIT